MNKKSLSYSYLGYTRVSSMHSLTNNVNVSSLEGVIGPHWKKLKMNYNWPELNASHCLFPGHHFLLSIWWLPWLMIIFSGSPEQTLAFYNKLYFIEYLILPKIDLRQKPSVISKKVSMWFIQPANIISFLVVLHFLGPPSSAGFN